MKLRRHFVLMIEGKQRRSRRENEQLCLAKVTVEKAQRSDIPDMDKKKSVLNFSN